ncbi:MAG: hypothetical protein KDA84_21460 [Planctomycetaceae bacterium]|nr:hypothetical protein [Planctomycetaceae bacterium]
MTFRFMLTKLRTIWQSAGWGRCWIFLPLWLTLWNAPLPWVHRHDLDEVQVDQDLDRHLKLFHQASQVRQESATWHWHLALLCQMVNGGEHSQEEGQPSPNLLIEDQCPCINTAPDLPSQPSDQPSLGRSTVMDLLAASELTSRVGSQERWGSHHFLQTYLSKAPLRDLLSVARC